MSKEEYRVGRTVIDKKSFDKTINTDFYLTCLCFIDKASKKKKINKSIFK